MEIVLFLAGYGLFFLLVALIGHLLYKLIPESDTDDTTEIIPRDISPMICEVGNYQDAKLIGLVGKGFIRKPGNIL